MKKEEFKAGMRITSRDWKVKSFVDLKFVDDYGMYGVDDTGCGWLMDFWEDGITSLFVVTGKEKVWLDGDDLPQIFLVRFEDKMSTITLDTDKKGFRFYSKFANGAIFYNYYSTEDQKILETAEWTPITEIKWQKFYR